jgi:hypothetical protein
LVGANYRTGVGPDYQFDWQHIYADWGSVFFDNGEWWSGDESDGHRKLTIAISERFFFDVEKSATGEND